MKPEDSARKNIDRQLEAAGWRIQDRENLDLGASPGVAIREFSLKSGLADYALFVNRKLVGVVEAKPEGTTLSGVAEQSQKYLTGVPESLLHVGNPPPFAYETTGVETFFRDECDPYPRSRRVFAFHRPQTLQEWIEEKGTLRAQLLHLPPLIKAPLRDCQIEAIEGLDQSFKEARPKALIQMASGSGKTYTAISFIYRLIKFAGAERVLFLVDRSNLGRQTAREFQQYSTPDDGRKFTELYNVQHLRSNKIDKVNKVCITTIQRLYSMLSGETEYHTEDEEGSLFDTSPERFDREQQKEVIYNPSIPIETFDFIVTDECHRSIYNVWRPVLDYFDAFVIGLTATPSMQTLGFFDRNLVTEYSHERAVADGVNVGYEVYRIKTQITEEGSKIEAGFHVDMRDKLTRARRWERLDEDLKYESRQLDREVVAPDQIRMVIKTFKDRLFTEIFPGRTEVPKTLIFAKDDSHAEDIVHIVREEFGKGNEFCKKITYRTTGESPENLITSFRNSYNPRVAVTVDMISTGTDIRPLECLLFMRSIKSRVYFEQMKGRGTRTISDTDIKAVTPDTNHKTHFVIVDAIGVCEDDKTDSRPLVRKRSIPFEKLIFEIALGKRDEDTITTLAGRLGQLDQKLNDGERAEISEISGVPIKDLTHRLLDAVDPDKKIEKAKELFSTDEPDEKQIEQAGEVLVATACDPFDNPLLRNKLIELRQRSEQVIDTVSSDQLLSAGFDEAAKEKAKATIGTFKQFIEDNKDELTALQIIYNRPHSTRHMTYDQIRELAETIEKPPYHIAPEQVWKAYEQLEKSKVRGASPHKLLTDIISLVRFTIGDVEILEPFHETVTRRFDSWLDEQEQAGTVFTPQQREWLKMIKNHIASSLSIGMDDFEYVPFAEKGGPVKAYQLFGDALDTILETLNEQLVA